MKYRVIIFIAFTICIILIFKNKAEAQQDQPIRLPARLKIESGFVYDSRNSFGTRLKIEWLRQINERWEWGLAYDTKWHLFFPVTDRSGDMPIDFNSIAGHAYFCLNPSNHTFKWKLGAGTGFIHLVTDGNRCFGAIVNGSFSATIRLTDALSLYASPLVFLIPLSDYNYTSIRQNENAYRFFSLFPLGLIIRM